MAEDARVIRANGLDLRPSLEEDAPALFSILADPPNAYIKSPEDVDQVREAIGNAATQPLVGSVLRFTACADDGTIVGSVELVLKLYALRGEPGAELVPSIEPTIVLRRDHRKEGLPRKIKDALLPVVNEDGSFRQVIARI